MNKKRICIFTSNRADFGVLTPLMHTLKKSKSFDLHILASGSHLDKHFGGTIAEVHKEGFKKVHVIKPTKSLVTEAGVFELLALLQQKVPKFFRSKKIEALVLLGDRMELLPVATVAAILEIPIIHISGGDTTSGAIDNQIRHAVSKLSQLHFPSTLESRKRLLNMGEDPACVHVVGELGIEKINSYPRMSLSELSKSVGMKINKSLAIVTFHPETISKSINAKLVIQTVKELLSRNFQVIATAANFDFGGVKINKALKSLSKSRKDFKFVESLGIIRYYSALSHAAIVVGNSSSGVIETQSFAVPCINVGRRQEGRLTNQNTVSCKSSLKSIKSALDIALKPEFVRKIKKAVNLYGDGNSSNKIVKEIERYLKRSGQNLIKK